MNRVTRLVLVWSALYGMAWSGVALGVEAPASTPPAAAVGNLELGAKTLCKKPRMRREFRELSPGEWQQFVTALKVMMQRPAVAKGFAPSLYDEFAARDAATGDESKGYAAFLAYNRLQLKVFESALQKLAPTVDLPYWDWTIDAAKPQESPLLSAAYLGGNGEGPEECVKTGAFAGYEVPASGGLSCLRRAFNQGTSISPFHTKANIQKIIAKTRSYDGLRQFMVYAPSGAVMQGIGGQLAGLEPAQDPIYWLHMAFIDKVWALWQAKDSKRLRSVGGMLKDSSVAKAKTMLPRSMHRIEEVFALRDLCYGYSQSAVEKK